MAALTPKRREALEAVRDGRVTFWTRFPATWSGPISGRTLNVVEGEGLIKVVSPDRDLSAVRLTPAGVRALEGEHRG